ncbi:MAG TPA: hypothetical protein VMD31_08230, partial [Opitutaceae bacterium]|nr:hypothetical protein [Opitutaceae bacterium]
MNPTPTVLRRRLLPAVPACLFLIATASAQTVAPPPATEPAATPAAMTPARPAVASTEQVVKLSPFEVKAETIGYFQSNAISGTRLNSRIEDLGQSITVMTKEQM